MRPNRALPATLQAMQPNWYERHILPTALDMACGMPMIGRMRQHVVPRAQGRVLEVDLIGLSAEQIPLPDASVQRWQERLQPLWGKVAGGCHLGRDVPALLQGAGFALPDLQTRYLTGPRPFTFHYWGEALPA